MLKICSISDTHNRHRELEMPEADILIVAGDITENGSLEEVNEFNEWLGEIKHKYKAIYVIAGNHDFVFQKIQGQLILSNAIYLEDSHAFYPSPKDYEEGNGFLIYGSPVQPWFGGWAFNVQRGAEIQKHWDRIPKETDILITHGPPYKILDSPSSYTFSCTIPKHKQKTHVGCKNLANTINSLHNLKVNIFGHVHHSYGIEVQSNIKFVNSSSAPHPYKKVNRPQIFDI